MLTHALVMRLIVQYSRCIRRPWWHEYLLHDGHGPVPLRGATPAASAGNMIDLALMLVLGCPEVATLGRRRCRQ